MADSSARSSSTGVSAAWERFYHLLGRGYAFIAQHPETEAEILGLFRGLDTVSIEGTELGREYKTFPTIFINFLEAYRNTRGTVMATRVVDAHHRDQLERLESANLMAENHKRTIRFANEQVLFLIGERERLADRLASLHTCLEHDPSDIILGCKCDWLAERIECLTADIALERSLIGDLESVAEQYEASVARIKEECNRLFFRHAILESESVQCRHSINGLESQLNSFVMLIRAHFGFTFPPQ